MILDTNVGYYLAITGFIMLHVVETYLEKLLVFVIDSYRYRFIEKFLYTDIYIFNVRLRMTPLYIAGFSELCFLFEKIYITIFSCLSGPHSENRSYFLIGISYIRRIKGEKRFILITNILINITRR